MPSKIYAEPDLDSIGQDWQLPPEGNGTEPGGGMPEAPVALSVADILALKAPEQRVLIEKVLPSRGAIFFAGAHKTGKTVVAVQMAISVASGHPFMENYPVREPGAVIIVEQDDPAGGISVQDYFKVSPVPVTGLPISTFVRINHYFGPTFSAWLTAEIKKVNARAVILDSYTALRPGRERGGDLVKAESDEITQLNEIGLNCNCLILPLHHDSKGTFGMDWSDRLPGTYAMGAGSDGQIHISRFRDSLDDAKERILRVRTRHGEDHQMVIRFRKSTLDYELVFDGPAACMFPELQQIHTEFSNGTFTPKELYQATGLPRATAFRLLARLRAAGAVTWRTGGNYSLATEVLIALQGRVDA
jgi:RecA-family ATPase